MMRMVMRVMADWKQLFKVGGDVRRSFHPHLELFKVQFTFVQNRTLRKSLCDQVSIREFEGVLVVVVSPRSVCLVVGGRWQVLESKVMVYMVRGRTGRERR